MQVSVLVFKSSLGNSCHSLELEAVVRCDGLCSQFSWNLWFINPALWISKTRGDVIENAHQRKLMGFLGQTWELDNVTGKKGIGVTNGWGVGSLLSNEKVGLATQNSLPPAPAPPYSIWGIPLCGSVLPGMRKHKALLGLGSQEFSSIRSG